MKLRLFVPAHVGTFIAATFLSLAQPCTLPQARTFIAISNATGDRDTLWFGFDSAATCGEDPSLCEVSVFEPCGAPSTFFCIYWWNPCGDPLWRYDFRRYVSPSRVDTHRIGFQPGEGGFPLTFRWNRQAIAAISDSSVLKYYSGETRRQHMESTDSLIITDENVFDIRLFRYGERLTSVPDHGHGVEYDNSFLLEQNYPNPFNPSTTIRYTVRVGTHIRMSLRVYDVLGREIATLVDGLQQSGDHEVQWRAEGMPSGIYIYRLTTPEGTLAGKMLLLR